MASVLEDDEGTSAHQSLSDMSLEEVQSLRNKLGIKQFNKKFGLKKLHTGPASKNRSRNYGPVEVSSKRPPNLSKLASQKVVTRDPRFDDLSGEFNEQLFKRSYKFIDKLKAKEFKAVSKIAEDEGLDEETRRRAKDMLTRLGQRKAAKKKVIVDDTVEQRLKEERKQAIKEGRKPFFLKSSEKQKLVLAEKYKELKEKGQLDSYVKKKRQQNSKKGSMMPTRTER
ncbi:RRP36 [Bugula neritina]|uniref:rRNA biogenesis protein RRP36 n=1 Tax=Bugula neritina TaxID=10212 RepID=A0A7J7IY02_BUGNE|nr:RRP36 [Bugula neritina]